MGRKTFMTFSKAETAKEAFSKAIQKARYDYGNRGYTGTIAEKNEYTIIKPENFKVVPKGSDKATIDAAVNFTRTYADGLINNRDPRIDGKWGPAGCIQVAENLWLFFGWASS